MPTTHGTLTPEHHAPSQACCETQERFTSYRTISETRNHKRDSETLLRLSIPCHGKRSLHDYHPTDGVTRNVPEAPLGNNHLHRARGPLFQGALR